MSDQTEEARRLIDTYQGNQLIHELQKKGLDLSQMKSVMAQVKNTLTGVTTKSDTNKTVIVITSNRQLKTRNIPNDLRKESLTRILNGAEPVTIPCSRLALGPLANKNVLLAYDPDDKVKNKRLSKILGFPVNGTGIFFLEEDDLTEDAFIKAELLLVQ